MAQFMASRGCVCRFVPARARRNDPVQKNLGNQMARRATGRRGRDARAQAFPAPALDGPGSVAGSLGVLAAIVFVHELGHFTAAKARGVRVSKFALGFGPKVLQREWDGVELSLRAVPLGGFVGFPDDDPDSPYPPDDAFLLRNRPLGDRALVISAGVMANIMFAFTIFLSQASTIGHQEQVPKDGLYVPDVFQESSASSAGIRSGDTILSLDESPLPRGQDGVRRLIDTVRSRPHQPVHLTLQHQGAPSPEDVTLTPEAGADGSGRARMTLQPNYDTLRAKATGPVDAVAMAFRDTYGMGASVLQGIWSVFANLAKNSSQMSSPVAIVATGAEMAQQDASSLFQFAAAINMNLAVVNILPLPALDGGYLALMLVEALRGGRKLSRDVEQRVVFSGLLLLASTSLVLVLRDTVDLLE